MSKKLLLMGIAIFAVGIIALPETLALFADQHTWYAVNQQTASGDYGIPCIKCHEDIQQQMESPENKVHNDMSCESCHILSQISKGATLGGTGSIHAAASPACLDCHSGFGTFNHEIPLFENSNYTICAQCHIPANQGTPNFFAPDGSSILYGANESHIKFAMGASNASLLKDSNEACIACHTHVAVDIVWNKPTNISFNASVNTDGVWTVGDFTATGNKTTSTTGQ